jgi:hypothetical protein
MAMLLGGTILFAGCSGSVTRPPIADLEQGLNIFSSSDGFSGAYVKGQHGVYFESLRGGQTPEVYRTYDPSWPQFEMDARFLDENGRLLYIRVGGDRTVDSTWARDVMVEASKPHVDPALRADSFALLKEATTAIEQAAVASELKVEQTALVQARGSVRDTLLDAKAIETSYYPGYNSIEMYTRNVWLVGEHSTTWANIWGTVYVSCNHGPCASWGEVSYKCTAWGSGGVNYQETASASGWNVNTSVNWPGCLTPYSWTSWGNHNCHDDTVRQLWGVRYGWQGDGYSGVCNNGAGHTGAPNCDTNSW